MITILLILSVAIGVILGKFFGGKEDFVKFILIVSAGFLIAVCLIEIFPTIYTGKNHEIGIWVIAGVLLQMFLENLTKGFEHGHFHHQDNVSILPYTLMIGLFIHAFIEGIPLALVKDTMSPFLQGILIHNIPISFILGAFLFKSDKMNTFTWIIILIFSLASPLGMWMGKFFPPDWIVYFLAIVAGIFLHISSVIIFESNKNHNIDWSKMGMVIIGVVFAMLLHHFHS